MTERCVLSAADHCHFAPVVHKHTLTYYILTNGRLGCLGPVFEKLKSGRELQELSHQGLCGKKE